MFGCQKWAILPIHQIHLGYYPFKENLGVPGAKENLTSVGFEPMTSGLDLPMLYRLSYEASTGAGRGNLGSELRLIFK